MKSALLLGLSLIVVPLPALPFGSSDSGGGDVHGDITREALHGTISDTNLNFMIKAEASQDAAGGEGASESRRHFSDGNFTAALAYIDREKKKALNYAADADTDPSSRAQALRHFALALHTVQDFYGRTNYLELQLEDGMKRRDPYNLELVDWSRVPDGYAGKTSGAQLASSSGIPGDPALDFNKDSATTPEGKKTVGDATYFKVARDMALRETQRQWNLFEALIRGRYRTKADAIIAALKSASPAEGSSPDAAPDLD